MKKKNSNPIAAIAAATTLFALHKTTKRMIKVYTGGAKRIPGDPKRRAAGFEIFESLNLFRRG